MPKLQLQDLSLDGKKVLLRVDFNVPLDEGTITDDTRIKAALPTIQYILEHGGSVVLMSHLGRPKGKVDPSFSLEPVAKRLSELLGKKVEFCPNCIGEEASKMKSNLKRGEILLLENLRFDPREEKPDSKALFAKELAKGCDLFVNDAFGTAHRAHSSTAIVNKEFEKTAAGILIQKEISFLGEAMKKPQKPFYAILGGAKVSSKLKTITVLLEKVDALFIGGGMAYTFLKEQGFAIGNSLFEEEMLPKVREIVALAKEKEIPIHLPVDLIVAEEFSNTAQKKCISVESGIPDNWEGMDIGPQTIQKWKELLHYGKTIFWNGPLGVFEMDNFAKGTEAIAKILASSSAITIVGGGDSIAAISKFHLEKSFSHLSTGGGASLEFIEKGGKLPGIEALSDR